MDLETINNEYEKLKSDLETAHKEIDVLKNKANDLADDKIIWKGKLIEAKRNNDSTAEKQAEGELDRIDTEIKAVQEETVKKREEIIQIQEKINERINEIKENPEMKKHLDEVLSKKYERKISKIQKEKEETVEKKDKLMELNQLIIEHPTLGNNLKGWLKADKEIDDLEAELNKLLIDPKNGTYSDPGRAQTIITNLLPLANNKLQNNKNSLMSYIEKSGKNISEKDIMVLAGKKFNEKKNEYVIDPENKGPVVDKNGNIDLTTTMNRNMARLNRQIKGYDKSIRNHQIALDGIRNERQGTSQNTPTQNADTQEQTTNTNSPKWYQLIQRFKNWNEKRKQRALPQSETPEIEDSEEENASHEANSEKNEFSNSLKYKIVKDYAENMEKENLQKAKEIRKEEEKEID